MQLGDERRGGVVVSNGVRRDAMRCDDARGAAQADDAMQWMRAALRYMNLALV